LLNGLPRGFVQHCQRHIDGGPDLLLEEFASLLEKNAPFPRALLVAGTVIGLDARN